MQDGSEIDDEKAQRCRECCSLAEVLGRRHFAVGFARCVFYDQKDLNHGIFSANFLHQPIYRSCLNNISLMIACDVERELDH